MSFLQMGRFRPKPLPPLKTATEAREVLSNSERHLCPPPVGFYTGKENGNDRKDTILVFYDPLLYSGHAVVGMGAGFRHSYNRELHDVSKNSGWLAIYAIE